MNDSPVVVDMTSHTEQPLVHTCSDQQLKDHICKMLDRLQRESNEVLVEKLLKIVRQNDQWHRSSREHPTFQCLPTERVLQTYLRCTWTEKQQFMYIADDISEYVKEDGYDLGEMEFIFSVTNSTIHVDNPDIMRWAEEWAEGKDQEMEVALQKWVFELPLTIKGYPRPYLA